MEKALKEDCLGVFSLYSTLFVNDDILYVISFYNSTIDSTVKVNVYQN